MKINGVLEGGLLEDNATASSPNEIGAITTGAEIVSDIDASVTNVRPVYVGNGTGKSRLTLASESSAIATRLGTAELDILALESSVGTNLKARPDLAFADSGLNSGVLYLGTSAIANEMNGMIYIPSLPDQGANTFGFGNGLNRLDIVPASGILPASLEIGAVYNLLITQSVYIILSTKTTALTSTIEFIKDYNNNPSSYSFVTTNVPCQIGSQLIPANVQAIRVTTDPADNHYCFRRLGRIVSDSISLYSIGAGTVETQDGSTLIYKTPNGKSGSDLFIEMPSFNIGALDGAAITLGGLETYYQLFKA